MLNGMRGAMALSQAVATHLDAEESEVAFMFNELLKVVSVDERLERSRQEEYQDLKMKIALGKFSAKVENRAHRLCELLGASVVELDALTIMSIQFDEAQEALDALRINTMQQLEQVAQLVREGR